MSDALSVAATFPLIPGPPIPLVPSAAAPPMPPVAVSVAVPVSVTFPLIPLPPLQAFIGSTIPPIPPVKELSFRRFRITLSLVTVSALPPSTFAADPSGASIVTPSRFSITSDALTTITLEVEVFPSIMPMVYSPAVPNVKIPFANIGAAPSSSTVTEKSP